MTPPAIILVMTPCGYKLAQHLRHILVDAQIHALQKTPPQKTDPIAADLTFPHLASHLQNLFLARHPLIGICASAILIRILAPVLRDKTKEPPVLAISEDGRNIVPLLGGHHGANRLARKIAGFLNAHAAITTASEARLQIALDAPPAGWVLRNQEQAKSAMRDLLGGAQIQLYGNAPWLYALRPQKSGQKNPPVKIHICNTRKIPANAVVYTPQNLVLGVGCKRGCTLDNLLHLVQSRFAQTQLTPLALSCITSIDLKEDEPAIHQLADHFGVPARFFSPQSLAQENGRLANPSEYVYKLIGCYGVCEGAALAGVGQAGSLIWQKQKQGAATCALAGASLPVDVAKCGRARGRLTIIGIGPGGGQWRSKACEEALRQADIWVGYHIYLDLLSDVPGQRKLYPFRLGEEQLRAKTALELAATGKKVALISSGDSGIYAMGAVVFGLLDDLEQSLSPAARRIEVISIAGQSAMQTLAQLVGAPLGHDFCAISLSDLLTPVSVIENRVKAAAKGDFVVAFYNPASRQRQLLLPAMLAILQKSRPRDTPLAFGANLTRTGENWRVTTLAEFDPTGVDMNTIIMIGNRQSRQITIGGQNRFYTPRGYEKKPKQNHEA